jgi:hypothetical protein
MRQMSEKEKEIFENLKKTLDNEAKIVYNMGR